MLIHTLKLCVNLIYELSTEAIHHMIYIIKIMQIQENNTMDCIFKFIKVMQIQEYNKIWFYFQIHFFKQFQFSVILWYIWAGCVHVCICTYKVWLNLETKSYILFQSCADIKKNTEPISPLLSVFPFANIQQHVSTDLSIQTFKRANLWRIMAFIRDSYELIWLLDTLL